MTNLSGAVFICPNCNASFTGTIAISFGHAGTDTDFYPKFWGANPLPYFVKVCPSCNYADDNSEFKQDKPRPSPEEIPAELKMPCWRKYELVAESYQKRGASAFTIGQFLHRAAWCCRVVDKEPGREQNFLRRACTSFQQALREGSVPENQRLIFTYLIGELHRRTGDAQMALHWFERILLNTDKLQKAINDADAFDHFLQLVKGQVEIIHQSMNSD